MPIVPVSGSERFATQPPPLSADQRSVGSVHLHTVDQSIIDQLDALTYEVIRHRLVAITDPGQQYRIEKGEAF